MVQIDIPAAFVVSMFSIDLGRRKLVKEHNPNESEKSATYYKYLFRSILFAGIVIAPAGIYLLSGWPGWENIYWSKRFEEVMRTGWVNALFPTLFVLFIVLSGYIGHVFGYRLLTSGKEKYIRPIYIGILILVGIIVLLNYPSFLLEGTYDQYHNLNGHSRGEMVSVLDNPHGFSVAWFGVMIFFTASFLYLAVKIKNEAKL